MLITKPDYYDEFSCIADKCDETCCIGWQIMIDDDSLKKYKNTEGELGDRLRAEVDYEEGFFKQKAGKCTFLNSNGLCALQTTFGEDMLCNTCKKYPRHTEEYEDVRELSLSLSCPAAADIMLSRKEKWNFVEEETDDFDDDFEDFDFFMYDKLVVARDLIYEIISNRNLKLITRMKILLALGQKLQNLHNENRLCEAEAVLDFYRQILLLKEPEINETFQDSDINNFGKMKALFSSLYDLEMLNPGWIKILDNTWNKYYDKNISTKGAFENIDEQIEIGLENILMFFVYTYFCGAVYDDEIYSKVALCVYSTKWIFEIFLANDFDEKPFINLRKSAVKYAREIEHSDLNIEAIENIFINK